MTRSDFLSAIGRYCLRMASSDVDPDRILQVRATLRDFLRELEQDFGDHPELFDHPRWAQPAPQSPAAASPTRAQQIRDALDRATCRQCGRSGSILDEFTSPRTGLCANCSKEAPGA